MAILKSGAGQRPCRVAIAGFGTVGQSVARLMLDLQPRELELVAIFNRDVSRKRVDWIPSSVRWTDNLADVLDRRRGCGRGTDRRTHAGGGMDSTERSRRASRS